MADYAGELLSVKEWLPAHQAQVGYVAQTQETPPVVTDPNQFYRFARVQAHDGVLLVRTVKNGGATPAAGSALSTGDIRIPAGGDFTFQLSYGMTVYLLPLAGTVNGAVIWGR